MELRAPASLSAMAQHERTSYVLFATNVFASLEDEMVRAQALRLVSLPLWHALSPGRLQLELHAQPALAKRWKALAKKDARAAKDAAKGGGGEGAAHVPAALRAEATFIPGVVDELLGSLAAADEVLAAAAAGGAVAANGGAVAMEGVVEEAVGGAAADGGEEEEEEEESEGESDEEQEVVEEAAAAAAAAVPAAVEETAAAAAAQPAAAAAGAKSGPKGRRVRGPRLGPGYPLLLHIERCVELVVDLLSQLPTRRFVHSVLDDRALMVKARLSGLYRAKQGDRCDAALVRG